jgi:KDO2-lipid IV(A) lauroyltransferase
MDKRLFPAPTPKLSQRILLAPLGALLWLVARLPQCVSHLLADIVAWLAGSVIHYRRRIVRRNLADSFPDKSVEELRAIEKGFYRNLADYFFQTIRFTAMSPKRVMQHIEFRNTQIISDFIDKGKNVILYTYHYGNWEYVTSMGLWMPGYEHVIYAHVNRPLKNLWFNRLFWRLRSRFNVSVPMKKVLRTMVTWRRDKQPFVMGFLSDQKPGKKTSKVEAEFLGRPTPFIAGTEELARQFAMPVVYCDLEEIARDKYVATIRLMTDDASQLQEGALTRQYAAMLTETIRRNPALYLWSHNRWRI